MLTRSHTIDVRDKFMCGRYVLIDGKMLFAVSAQLQTWRNESGNPLSAKKRGGQVNLPLAGGVITPSLVLPLIGGECAFPPL